MKRLRSLCLAPETIVFPGFLQEPEFHTYLQRLDLMVTLRFPTCGETSGLVAHALRDMEQRSQSVSLPHSGKNRLLFRISVDPVEEVDQLAQAMILSFQNWRNNKKMHNQVPSWVGQKNSMAKKLISMMA